MVMGRLCSMMALSLVLCLGCLGCPDKHPPTRVAAGRTNAPVQPRPKARVRRAANIRPMVELTTYPVMWGSFRHDSAQAVTTLSKGVLGWASLDFHATEIG